MLRRLVKFYMIASVVLAVLLGIAWAISGIRDDAIFYGASDCEYVVRSDWGRLIVARTPLRRHPIGFRHDSGMGGYHQADALSAVKWRHEIPDILLIVGSQRIQIPFTIVDYFHITVFYWFPFAILLLPPLVWMYWHLRKRRETARRVRENRCVVCGYDLRGSADRCPECGYSMSKTTHPIAA